jgi:hypothetical protein
MAIDVEPRSMTLPGVLVAVLIGSMPFSLSTYAVDPSLVMTMPVGSAPTLMVAVTVFVAVSMASTELDPEFTT